MRRERARARRRGERVKEDDEAKQQNTCFKAFADQNSASPTDVRRKLREERGKSERVGLTAFLFISWKWISQTRSAADSSSNVTKPNPVGEEKVNIIITRIDAGQRGTAIRNDNRTDMYKKRKKRRNSNDKNSQQ